MLATSTRESRLKWKTSLLICCQLENTSYRVIAEVKQYRAQFVLGWVTVPSVAWVLLSTRGGLGAHLIDPCGPCGWKILSRLLQTRVELPCPQNSGRHGRKNMISCLESLRSKFGSISFCGMLCVLLLHCMHEAVCSNAAFYEQLELYLSMWRRATNIWCIHESLKSSFFCVCLSISTLLVFPKKEFEFLIAKEKKGAKLKGKMDQYTKQTGTDLVIPVCMAGYCTTLHTNTSPDIMYMLPDIQRKINNTYILAICSKILSIE